MESTNILGIAIFAAYMLAILGPLSWAVFLRDARQPVATDSLSDDCFCVGPRVSQELNRLPKMDYDPDSDSLRMGVPGSRAQRKLQLASGLIIALDENGAITGFELLNASRAVSAPIVIEPRVRQGSDQRR